MTKYELVIIGAGPAGYYAALRAAQAGIEVVLFEKDKLGGTCLNKGCIPIKTFLYSAKIIETIKEAHKYGINPIDISIDYTKIITRKNKIINILTSALLKALSKSKVKIIYHKVNSISKEKNNFLIKTDENSYLCSALLIATGSKIFLPQIEGLSDCLDKGIAVTNKEALNWAEIPKKLIIIGAGAIGLEFASFFNALGSEVSLLDILPTIGGLNEKEISFNLQNNLTQKGLKFFLASQIKKINKQSLILQTKEKEEELFFDKILISTGRKPNLNIQGLEELGVVTNNGSLKTDNFLKTNLDNLYAAGDVNGISLLAHTAYREAEVVINNLKGIPDSIDYKLIPQIIYTNPEVATIGETEETALKNGYAVKSVIVSMRYAGRYLAENDAGNGICKVIADKKNKHLLGFHIISNYASEIIYGLSLILRYKLKITDITKLIFPHPTISEIIREAALQLED